MGGSLKALKCIEMGMVPSIIDVWGYDREFNLELLLVAHTEETTRHSF